MPPSGDAAVERKRKAARDRRARIRAGPPSGPSEQQLALRSQLAELMQKEPEELPIVKYHDGLFDPVDVLMMVSGKNRNHSAEELRNICEKYVDVNDKIVNVDVFRGRGMRPDSKGADLPTILEIVVLSPSRAAARIRRGIVEVFCRVYGGDLSLVPKLFEARRVQEHLRQIDPEHPLRAFGEYVERSSAAAPDDLKIEILKEELAMRREQRARETERYEEQKAREKEDYEERKAREKADYQETKRREKEEYERDDKEREEERQAKRIKRDEDLRVSRLQFQLRTREIAEQLKAFPERERAKTLLPLSLTKIIEGFGHKTSELPSNFKQLFEAEFRAGNFRSKTMDDFDPIAGEVKWYDTNLEEMWDFMWCLIEKKAAPIARGQLQFSFSRSRPERPSLEELKSKFSCLRKEMMA